VDGDQRHGFGGAWITQTFNDLGTGQPHATAWAGLLRLDKLAIFGAIRVVSGHMPFFAVTFVDGQNPPTFG